MPTPPVPAEKVAEVRRRLAAGESHRDIRRAVGVSAGTISKIANGVPVGEEKLGRAAGERPDPVREERDRAEREKERREHINAVKELAFRDLVRESLGRVVAAMDPPPAYRPPRPTSGTVTESMLLHLSDWHAFEFVRAANTFGLNEYDLAATERRVRRIVSATLEIKSRLESGGYRFPVLVVAANGDMVSGTIHEVERHTDGPNALVAALDCSALLAAAVRDLSAAFERVFLFGTSGNHGRLGDAKKIQTKEPTRSWDYLIYEHARALLRDCPNVAVEVPDAWAVMYELEGKLFYQGHGHFVKSWNSIPFYGINRMTSRLGAVLAKHFRPVDYWLFGHFHTHGSIENAGGEYLINPPLIGPQEYGMHAFGDAVPPGQTLFGVHPKYGITHRWRLAAEEVWPPPNRSLRTTKIRSGG